MSNRTGLVIIAILILHAAFTYLFSHHFLKAPLKADVDLTTSFSNEYSIYVPMEQTYAVNLKFEREGKDFDYLNSVLGDMSANPPTGIPLDVNWKLSDQREFTIEKNIQAYNSCGWSQKYVDRCLGEFLVPAGNYLFTLVISNPKQEFKNFNADLTINFNFKNAHTWHTGYVFFAQIFNVFVAPVVGGFILLFLGYRYVSRT